MHKLDKLSNITTAIILVGGLGTRLGNLTKITPKPLLKINGIPFINYLLRSLKDHGFKNIVTCACYKSDLIKKHCGNGIKWDINISYSIEQIPLGTGGAIITATRDLDSDYYLVLNGDTFFNCSLTDFLISHKQKNCDASICLKKLNDISRYGTVKINKKGVIEKFIEKGKSGYGIINSGIYIFNKSVLQDYQTQKTYSLEYDILPSLMTSKICGHVFDGTFIDIGTNKSFKEAQVILSEFKHL